MNGFTKYLCALAAVLLTVTISSTYAQSNYRLVTFGPQASISEGDPYHQQVLFIKVPGQFTDSVYIRLFDPDCGGSNDQRAGDWNTSTLFTLYGGNAAYSTDFEKQENPSPSMIDAGTVIRKESFDVNPFYDNEWYTFARCKGADGFVKDGYALFKLVVRTTQGDDGNAFEVEVSASPAKSLAIPGASIFTYRPVLRFDKRSTDPCVRFTVGNDTQVEIFNYDLAGADVQLETNVRSNIPVQSSDDGTWASSRIKLLAFEKHTEIGIVIGKGRETPNDASFYFKGDNGRLLPVTLPVQAYVENIRPTVKKQISILSDCYTVVFDASQSSDKDNTALDYVWNFGDGASAAGMKVRHTYKEKKQYTADVLVTDNSEAVGNASYEIFPVPINREPSAVSEFKNVAAPFEEVVFSAKSSRDEDGAITKAVWNFGGAATLEGEQMKYKFEQPGRYSVQLSVYDNSISPCNTSSVTKEIWINAQPMAAAGTDFWVSPGQEFTLDGSKSYDPDGTIARYTWDLGGGITRDGKVVKHTFQREGLYKIVLTVEDDAGVQNSRSLSSLFVHVNARPVAKIGKDLVVAPNESIVFDAKNSTDADGMITKYHWDFGDGTKAQGVSVSYAYADPGTYKVKLDITDNSNTSTSSASDMITVKVNKQPRVTIGNDKLLTQSTVQFNGDGAVDDDGRIAVYEWTFGDGTSSSEKSPLHIYQNPGVYKVKLKVTDNDQTTNNSAEASIRVIINAKPTADAGVDQVGAPAQELSFTGRASFDADGSIASYNWDFDDGSTAAGRDVTHKFSKPGVYKVKLKVADNTGQPEAIDFDEVTVTVNDRPIAIAGNDQIVLPMQEVVLDASKSFDRDGELSKYEWKIFPTNETFNQAQVKLHFQQYGIYFAVLRVFDNSGAINSYSADTVKIKVNSQPTANAGANVYTCNSKIVFDASGSSDADGDPLVYVWDFGDGSPLERGVKAIHIYSKGGTYPVILKVDDGMKLANSTSVSSIKVVINEPPKADAGPDQVLCAGETVRFDAGGSKDPEGGHLRYTWDFGDGTTGDGINPTKIYKTGGAYQIKLKVEDDSGLPCNVDNDTKVVIISESPVANAGPDVTACANSVIQFDGSKSKNYDGVVNNYTWDFGDGSVGGGATPTHGYAKAGVYRVVLSITGDVKGECDNTDTDEMIVTVIDAPKVDFTVPQNFPVNTALQLSATQLLGEGINATAYEWDFGDGTTGTGKTVTKSFTKFGEYFIKVTLKTDAKTDCHTTSTRKLIVINEPPVAKFDSPAKTGLNQPVLFDASMSKDADGSIQQYEWNFGDGSSDAGVNVWHRYKTPGVYTVTLKVKDNTSLENNSSVATASIRVNSTPVPNIVMPQAKCPLDNVSFDGSRSVDADGKIVEYHWDFGDGNTAVGAKAEHMYALPGMYSITLSVDDGDGLTNSRSELVQQIQINHRSEVVIGRVPVLCKGEPVSIVPRKVFDADNDELRYTWQISDGSTYTSSELRHTFTKTGVFTATLTVDDGKGTACSKQTDAVDIVVNASPVVKAGGSRTGFTGGAHDALLFDASASSDPDGDPLQFVWDFGDGTKASGEKVFHLFERPGNYRVTLTANDNKGSACSRSSEAVDVVIKARD